MENALNFDDRNKQKLFKKKAKLDKHKNTFNKPVKKVRKEKKIKDTFS